MFDKVVYSLLFEFSRNDELRAVERLACDVYDDICMSLTVDQLVTKNSIRGLKRVLAAGTSDIWNISIDVLVRDNLGVLKWLIHELRRREQIALWDHSLSDMMLRALLTLATEHGSVTIMKYLHDDCRVTTFNGEHILYIATRTGDVSTVVYIIENMQCIGLDIFSRCMSYAFNDGSDGWDIYIYLRGRYHYYSPIIDDMIC
jgi:hypothetical protein